jgi:hypothetical protein
VKKIVMPYLSVNDICLGLINFVSIAFCLCALLFSQASQEIDSADDLRADTLTAISSPDYRAASGSLFICSKS